MKLILIILFSSKLFATVMVSHKGVWSDHQLPQNSMKSLKKALDHGFKGLEFDLHLTKDKKFVLSHEADISKMSDCKGEVSSFDSQEIVKCKILKNTLLPITQLALKKVKDPQYYVLLRDVIEQVFGDERVELIWLDIKGQTQDEVNALISELGSLPEEISTKVVIGNGNAEILKELKQKMPQFRYSLEGKWGSEPLVDYEKYFDGLGITHDVISLNVGIYMGHEPVYKLVGRKKRFWKLLDQYLVEAKARGVTTLAWTVNRDKKIEKLISKDIPYLLTDDLYPLD